MIRSSYKILFLFSLLLSSLFAQSQELNCRITVNSNAIQGTNKMIFETMQKALVEYMNNRSWTNHVFSNEERIECNFALTLNQQISSDEFKGQLQITSSRPIFGSGYNSPMLNHLDKNIQFRYAEGESLEFSPNSHNELTSLFAYYAYIIIAYDYDSYSPQGGTPFFEIAQQIVTSASSSPYPGWKAFDSEKNRYWLVENNSNTIYTALRDYSYSYHRKGLDKMASKAAEGRSTIANGLTTLLKVHRQKPNAMIMQVFFEVKANEFVSILSESPTSEGMRAYNLLKEIDESHATEYAKIIKK